MAKKIVKEVGFNWSMQESSWVKDTLSDIVKDETNKSFADYFKTDYADKIQKSCSNMIKQNMPFTLSVKIEDDPKPDPTKIGKSYKGDCYIVTVTLSRYGGSKVNDFQYPP